MKKQSASRSAFFYPRALISLGFCAIGVFLALIAFAGSPGGTALAADGQKNEMQPVQVGSSYYNDVSPALRDLPLIWPPRESEEAELREANLNPLIINNHVDGPDPVVQSSFYLSNLEPQIPGTMLNFSGIPFPGVGCNCAPPDTVGAVGATQYVQMVNEGIQVFNKDTGASVLGPVGITTLWAGMGGACETSGSGDPIVLYDHLADRWLVSQFAGSPPTNQCIAISTTNDATGSYNRYGFILGTNFFDYPHLAVWPDAYYMADNVFNSSGTARLGPQPFAFDRAKMLAGLPATFVTTGITNGNTEAYYLPADLDGSVPPPPGAPATFIGWPNTGVYKVFHFHADFLTPANTTFTLFASPPAASFTTLCPGNRNCVPQLGTATRLDAIGDRFMHRIAYRNFGTHESVVANYTVSSAAVAGVRWVEFRNVTNGPVTIFQESTYQPDTDWRWMGSLAMDRAGNLALGFSASSATINPQIRYAGRLVGDPVNTLAQGEATLFAGTGSQSGTGSRWGDYSAMTIDPVDDCTFWFTSEYYETISSFNWRTRIGNFKFTQCTPGPTPTPCPLCTPTPTPTPVPPTPTPTPTPTPGPTGTPCPGGGFSEGFDGVTAPALPVGWVAANAQGAAPLWVTSPTTPDTAPNDAFIDDPSTVSDKRLDTPNITITSPSAQISFRNNFALEPIAGGANFFDGGVLEVSSPNIAGGAFTDITNAAVGGSFVTGGYTGTISTVFMNPIGGRMAWSQSSGGYINTVANLGPNVNGQTIKLRFRMCSDSSVTGTGWRIDTIVVGTCGPTPTPGGGTPTPTPGGGTPTPTPACSPTSQGFDDITTLPGLGWVQTNHSTTIGTTGWFQGNDAVFPAQGGATTSYIGTNFNNTTGTNTISNWLLTPPVGLANGAVLTFWTRTVDAPAFPDRLQVRMSTNGASSNVGTTATDVGDFTALLLDINPTYTTTGYPNVWTQFTVTVSGVASPTTGRLALRYFVENGGPSGVNSDYIGIDTLAFNGVCGPTPTPGPPTPTPTPPGPTPTPCAGGGISENFDGVTAPALPAGWVAANAQGAAPLWVTSTTTPDTAPNDAFIDDPSTVSDKRLDTPNITITSPSAQVSFRNNFALEPIAGGANFFDGGVLEVSSPNIAGGAFTDITNAAVGGSFVTGGYTGTISTVFMNPIGGRMAWSQSSGGYINTVANLGPNVNGQTIKLRFRMCSDSSVTGTGWRIDTIVIGTCGPTPTPGGGTPTPTPGGGTPTPTPACSPTSQGFDDITTLPAAGWVQTNHSTTIGTTGWFQGNDAVFPAQGGATTSYIGTNFNNTTGTNTISNWLLTPPLGLQNGAVLTFWTRTVDAPAFPDRLQVRMSTNGASSNVGTTATDVGDFTTLLLDINPTYAVDGYPNVWTQFTVTVSGVASPTTGRLALRYFVEDGGPSGTNSDYIGIDTFVFTGVCGPTPTPGPTATATAAPTPTPGTPSPTPTPGGTATPTPGGSVTPTPTPNPGPAQAINLSTRLLVQTADNVGIGGFIITGTAPKTVLIRGIGPSLADFGVPNALANPVLELHGPPPFPTTTNNNWRDTQEAEIEATGIPPTNDLESAILATLDPGAYTAVIRGDNNGSGVALVEVYDLSPEVAAKLGNIATRAFVNTGNDIVIAGFILGNGTSDDKIVVRGIGPSLTQFGVPDALANPTLELRDSSGTLLIANDDWQSDPAQAAELIALNLAPTDPLESALVATLAPGAYTALLAGVNNTIGNGLVEVYDNPVAGTPAPTPTPGGTATPTPTPGGTPQPTPTETPTPPPGACMEAFDGVAAPALPAGWVASNPDPGDGIMWVTSTTTPDTAPNAAFINDQDGVSDKVLDSRPITINSASAQMTFRNNFDTEFSDGIFWDGGVLEVSSPNISGGNFVDVTDPLVGGSIPTGGYTGEISGDASNPLAGRMAWSGSSGGYINTVVDLGPNVNGQTITLRFRMGTDEAVVAPGWNVDTISITGGSCP